MVHTGDTGVVILLSNFHHIKALNTAVEIWISFKARKTARMISLDTITTNLGTTTCKGMAVFHAFTGSDSTCSFKFKASWCTKCHSSWRKLQLSSTLHSKHCQGWKKWQEILSVGRTWMSQSRTMMLIFSEWGYSHRSGENFPSEWCFGSTPQKKCLPSKHLDDRIKVCICICVLDYYVK